MAFSGALMAFAGPAHSQGLTLTLTPSDYHGFNIDCFGAKTGSIDLTVTGGTPPYTYAWTNGATTQDISALPAGYYEVRVRDSGTLSAAKDITLTEPDDIGLETSVYEYPNGYNVSCYSCYNGSVQVTPSGGVGPYTYAWSDGATTQNRTALGAADALDLELADANGCMQRVERMTLREPDRTDWTMGGNAGTDPSTQFIGTTDNKDVVFKSNGSERLRLLAGGDIKVPGFGEGLLKAGLNGVLQVIPSNAPAPVNQFPYWKTDGNYVNALDNSVAFIGTKDSKDFIVRTNNQVRLWVPSTGGLRIGANSSGPRLIVNNDGDLRLEIPSGETGTPLTLKRGQGDYIQFKRSADGGYWAIHNGNGADAENHLAFHYFPASGDPLLNRLTLYNTGKVSIGGAEPGNGNEVYKLYVAGGIATRDVRVTAGAYPDFVFEPDYQLAPLDEVKRHIQEHHSLPGMLTERDVAAIGGVEIGDLQVRILRNLEEQQLYILQLKEEIEYIRNKVDAK